MSGALLVELHRVHVPLRTPHVAAHGREEVRDLILVSVTHADATTGWGECPTLSQPGYGSEWTEQAWHDLVDRLAPEVAATGVAVAAPGHPMASGALADALVDLDLRRHGLGPEHLLGPLAATVRWGAALSLCPPGEEAALVARGEELVAEGAGLLVLKVRPGQTLPGAAALRRGLPEVPLALDANGSWGGAELDELRAADALGLAFVEQPAPATDLAASARVARLLDAPVALDEGVEDLAGLEAAVAAEAGSLLTVKAARAGGIVAAVALMEAATAAGWALHVGGMLETGVGRAGARLLAARPEVDGPSLVGPSALHLVADVVEASDAAVGPRLAVGAGPGLLPAPDPDRLAAVRVAHWCSR